MGYGHGIVSANSGTKSAPIRTKKYSREFATFFTNYASTSGDARVRIGSGTIIPGTISAKKGYPFCYFSSDDGSITNRKHFLRAVTSDAVSRGEHLLTFSA
jgi:hypothetical protein